LNAVLNLYHVHADKGGDGSRVAQHGGLLYHILDEHGKKIVVPIKASLFYNSPTLKYLEERFTINEAARPLLKARVKNANNPFERYADDVIVHCDSLKEAEQLLEQIRKRMEDCGLTLHPEKTKIVKCQKWGSDDENPNKSFDFLGSSFKPRKASTKEGRLIGTFSLGISSKAVKRIQA
jgi:hypothetical protein